MSELRWKDRKGTVPYTKGERVIDRVRELMKETASENGEYALRVSLARLTHVRGENVWVAHLWQPGKTPAGVWNWREIGEFKERKEAEARCVAMLALGLST